MSLLLLRWHEEGTSRVGAIRRANSDIVWRAAMGLTIGGPTPSDRTMRDYEAFLRERDPASDLPRYLLLFEHSIHLCMENGVASRAKWAMDSTPLYCYGAVLDTVRLLGDGLRFIGRTFARATGVPLLKVAQRWDLPLLLAKSTKGHLSIDWRDRDARSRVITELAGHATRIVAVVKAELGNIEDGPRKRALVSYCDSVLRVIEQDLETTADSRLVIAERVAQDRVISLSDPGARHGRKSKSQTFNGWKINVLGDVVSGLITAVSVTAGNGHDAPPGHELIARARRQRIEMRTVLADTAYGGAADRRKLLDQHGIVLIAPPPAGSTKGDAIRRREFAIDFTNPTAKCPNGVATTTVERVETHGEPHLRFRWPIEACGGCPLRERCLPVLRTAEAKRKKAGDQVLEVGASPIRRRNRLPTSGRVLDLHPLEQEMRAAREAWEDPEIRTEYRIRTQCERLISQVVRHGGRQARSWGQAAADLQAHAIATRCNLELYAQHLAAQLDKEAKKAA